MSRFSGGPQFNQENGTFTDQFGMPLFVPPNAFSDPNFRARFGIPTPQVNQGNPFPPPLSPPGPDPRTVQPGNPNTVLNRPGFPSAGISTTAHGQGTFQPSSGGAGADGAALPPIFAMFQRPQNNLPPPTPLSNQDFLRSDPNRTVQAGSLAGLPGLVSLFGGGNTGLNLGGFNEALAASQSSQLADQSASEDARLLELRQDFARRGILNSGLAAGAEVDTAAQFQRAAGATRAGILGAGAQADLASQQVGINADLERKRFIMQSLPALLQGIPGMEQLLASLLGGAG